MTQKILSAVVSWLQEKYLLPATTRCKKKHSKRENSIIKVPQNHFTKITKKYTRQLGVTPTELKEKII